MLMWQVSRPSCRLTISGSFHPRKLVCLLVMPMRTGLKRVRPFHRLVYSKFGWWLALESVIKADHGYNLESRAVKNLIDVMSSYTKEERRAFLQLYVNFRIAESERAKWVVLPEHPNYPLVDLGVLLLHSLWFENRTNRHSRQTITCQVSWLVPK